jgi:hypothetical protein
MKQHTKHSIKHFSTYLFVVTISMFFCGSSAFAQGRSAGHGSAGSSHGNGNLSGMTGTSKSSASSPKTPGDLLQQNTNLSTKLQPLLPSTLTVQDASAGFKNLGQFVSAVHVSHNLGIPFDTLKCTELGGNFCTPTTTAKGMSLGKAISTLKPDVDAGKEADKATKQAHDDMSTPKT